MKSWHLDISAVSIVIVNYNINDRVQYETRKAPGALDPAVVLPPPPPGCKICYGHSR